MTTSSTGEFNLIVHRLDILVIVISKIPFCSYLSEQQMHSALSRLETKIKGLAILIKEWVTEHIFRGALKFVFRLFSSVNVLKL